MVLLLLVLVGIYYLLPQLGHFNTTLNILRHASLFWIAIGVVATGFTFWVAAITQFAAGDFVGDFGDIFWLQFAGYFANHFLPFSLGGIGLTTDYYHKLGKSRSRALVYATIPILFGVLTTILLVAIISPLTLVHLIHGLRVNPRARLTVLIFALGVALAILASLLYKQQLKKTIKEAIVGLRSIRDIRQMSQVAIGSIAITLYSSLALYASVLAVHTRMSLVATITLYITSSLVSNVAPTPGGLGATEAVLVFGFSSAGLSLPQAVACTLIFRFITFWLPLIPGGYALLKLNRKSSATAISMRGESQS